jgi:hypothetical protein
MNYLIGISGKAGHGKDSVADILSDYFIEYPADMTTLKIADSLKNLTARLLDVHDNFVNDQELKATPLQHMGGITPRKALQFIGTEVGRNLYHDIWVYHYLKSVDRFFCFARPDVSSVVFTTDVRFENEYNAIKNYKNSLWETKNILIRVERPGFVADNIDAEHPSETGLDHINVWDYRIIASNMYELRKEVGRVYKKLIVE